MEIQIHFPMRVRKTELFNDKQSSKNLKKLELEYENHLKKYPGPYNINDKCDSVHNELYRKWLKIKLDLLEKIEVYKAVNIRCNDIKKSTVYNRPERIKKCDKISVELYYEHYLKSIEYMRNLDHKSVEWKREASRARNLRFCVIQRAEIDGVPLPTLPILPQGKTNE